VQAIAPVVLLNVPAGQSVTEVLPTVATKEPAGAGVQANAPVLLLNFPAGQSVAEVLPGIATKEPAGA
jgi:hypothetical protein